MIFNNNCDAIRIGVNVGDHDIQPENILKEIKTQLLGGDSFFLRSRPETPLSEDVYYDISKFCYENKIYFAILYAYQHPPKGKRSHLNETTVNLIKSTAKEYFLGEIFAESGSQFTAMNKGYYIETPDESIEMPPQNMRDMHEAKEYYVNHLRDLLKYDRSIGINNCIMIEPTATGSYALEAGFDSLMLEMLPGSPDELVPFTRGSARGMNKQGFGCLIAHEWYGGYNHSDILKKKRLRMSYDYLFMQGADSIYIESGINDVNSFGEKHKYDSSLCKHYRNVHSSFSKYAKSHPRLKKGPLTEVAFIYGNDDGYSSFLGGSSWCQFDREEWGKSDRERSWEVLNEIFKSSSWFDVDNTASNGFDLSSAPSYGVYDVIPASTPLSILKKYKYLMFAGHNTMTEELAQRLIEYVKCGGILYATCAHINTSSARDDTFIPLDDQYLKELFGISIKGRKRINMGIKYTAESSVKGLYYPFSHNGYCDSNLPCGFTDIAEIELKGADSKCVFCDSFDKPRNDSDHFLTEYKNGKGIAIFSTNIYYPGNQSVYPLYRSIVRQIILASHKNAKIKVFGSDKLRFSVYTDNSGKIRVYLLNTSFDCNMDATVIYKRKKHRISVPSCKLIYIDI